jgi:hypothetical protein
MSSTKWASEPAMAGKPVVGIDEAELAGEAVARAVDMGGNGDAAGGMHALDHLFEAEAGTHLAQASVHVHDLVVRVVDHLPAEVLGVVLRLGQGVVDRLLELLQAGQFREIGEHVDFLAGGDLHARHHGHATGLGQARDEGDVGTGVVVGHGDHVQFRMEGPVHDLPGTQRVLRAGGEGGVQVQIKPGVGHIC